MSHGRCCPAPEGWVRLWTRSPTCVLSMDFFMVWRLGSKTSVPREPGRIAIAFSDLASEVTLAWYLSHSEACQIQRRKPTLPLKSVTGFSDNALNLPCLLKKLMNEGHKSLVIQPSFFPYWRGDLGQIISHVNFSMNYSKKSGLSTS